jgi:maleamate amidohydrolase
VRTTASDAAQLGFRPLVLREAVGDRSKSAHEAALEAIDALYGDVVTLAEACRYLEAR